MWKVRRSPRSNGKPLRQAKRSVNPRLNLPMKIISGGQIGADIAGLRAAKKVGLQTGGWMPQGFRTKEGPHPEYAELYGLIESIKSDYPHRTRLNVQAADCTIRLAENFATPGEVCTLRAIEFFRKPYLDCKIERKDKFAVWSKNPQEVAFWIRQGNFEIINIAGNAIKNLEASIERFLTEVFNESN